MRFCDRCGASFQSRGTCPRDRLPTRADIADPMLGAVIGERYRVLDRIAAGGMGQVYRASHVRIASLFAVKVLYGDLAYDEGMRARFQREAEATSLLSHRHIVRLLDFGETPGGLLYLTMEYVDGVSLSGLLARERRLDQTRAAMLARQIAKGLAHAHERGIVHRDLKTENVIVVCEDDDDEVTKVLDFGLAQVRSEARITQAGQVFGTPQYMAPEQFVSTDVDARADLYSLGIMLVEMLTGATPFDGTTIGEIARQHSTAPVPVIPDIAPRLQKILNRLLAKSPDERFPSARSLADALRLLSTGGGEDASLTASVPPPSMDSACAVPRSVTGPIEAAILRGAPAYNAGNYSACAALYARTAAQLIDGVLAAGPAAARARLRAAISRAGRASSPSEAAWEMRYALDDIYAATSAPRPAEGPGGWVGDEIALTEIIAAPRYAAGHMDTLGDCYLALVEELSRTIRASDPTSAAADYLDRVAHGAASRGGGQRALAYLHESLTALARGADAEPSARAPLSADAGASSPFEGCQALDLVAHRIVQALRTGVPAYNAGDPETCARVYRRAAVQIIDELGKDPSCAAVVSRLRAATAEAASKDLDGAAWALRRAFDELLATAARRTAPGAHR